MSDNTTLIIDEENLKNISLAHMDEKPFNLSLHNNSLVTNDNFTSMMLSHMLKNVTNGTVINATLGGGVAVNQSVVNATVLSPTSLPVIKATNPRYTSLCYHKENIFYEITRGAFKKGFIFISRACLLMGWGQS